MPKKRTSRGKEPTSGRKPSLTEENTELSTQATQAPVRAYVDEVATEVDLNLQSPKPRPKKSRIPNARTPAPAGAKPRNKMVMPGTKAAAGLAAQVRIMDIEKNLPTTNISILRLLRADLSQDEINAVEDVIKGKFEVRDLEGASKSPKRSLERLINHEVFKKLDKDTHAILFREIASNPNDISVMVAAQKLLDSKMLKEMRSEQRLQLFQIFKELSPQGREQLAHAAHRMLNGKSILFDRDFRDTSAIQHLFELSQRDSIPTLLEKSNYAKQDLLDKAVMHLAQPGYIYAEVLGPGVLSMLEFGLASYTPAEMARYWTGLTSKNTAIRLPKESTIQLHRLTTFDEIMGPMGAILEQLLPLAHPRGMPTHEALVMPSSHCLDADVIARCLGELYGIQFRVIADKEKVINYIRAKRPEAQRVPPIFFSSIVDEYERLFILDHCEDDSIYIRAPHGGSHKVKGNRRIDPMRTVVDPQIGQDMIKLETLEECIGVVIAPRN